MPWHLRPSDVFTPNRFPLEEHNAYVFRADAERELTRARSRNETPVVYGEYGVGKTTLIKRFFQDADREGRLVHVLTPGRVELWGRRISARRPLLDRHCAA